MEFPRAAAAHAPGDFLGDLATRLEARARPGPAPEAPALLWYAPSALDAEARRVLAGLPGAERVSAGGLACRSVAPRELAERAGPHPALRCLAAALGAALAPPPRALVMGILNVTPDSFSDGGEFLATERALERGRALRDEGADWLDVGGESTRPGAEPVAPEVELERVVPVLRTLAREGRAVLSVDTTKAEVARAALEAGARIVNDVSAGRNDPALLPLVAAHGAGLVLMHAQGTPRDMQRDPRYADVVREVAAHLRARARAAWEAGVAPERIVLDPGFGFGKRPADNLALLRALPELRALGFPLCVGLSRKSFLGHLSGQQEPARRGPETLAATALAAAAGAAVHRVHEVATTRAALAIAGALAADTGTAR
ncbi:MAG TPA: dihydropteroate synthase [Planctomycetota bacterium]